MKLPIVCILMLALFLSSTVAQERNVRRDTTLLNDVPARTGSIPIANGTQIPLWEKGAPGFEDGKNEAEKAESYWVANIYDPHDGKPESEDPVERASSKVDFQIQIYPGGGNIPETIPADAPPAFLLAAIDDQGPARTLLGLAEKYRAAKRPVELHLFAQGGHAFNMGNRSKLVTIREWSSRMADWMKDSKLLDKPAQ